MDYLGMNFTHAEILLSTRGGGNNITVELHMASFGKQRDLQWRRDESVLTLYMDTWSYITLSQAIGLSSSVALESLSSNFSQCLLRDLFNWKCWGLNPEHSACKTDALPTSHGPTQSHAPYLTLKTALTSTGFQIHVSKSGNADRDRSSFVCQDCEFHWKSNW